MPTTRHQLSRLPPIAAVAGIRMPPLDLRSPASRSRTTRTRSCSIRIGSCFSPSVCLVVRLVTRVLAGDLADQGEDHHEPDDPAGDLDDVVGARAVRVHEEALDRADLALGDGLRA